MKRISLVIMLILMLSLTCAGKTFCGWLDFYSTPVPAGAKEAAKEKAYMLGSDFIITVYDFHGPFDEVAKFYLRRLTQDGWEQMASDEKVARELAAQKLPAPPLMFRKGEDTIIVANLGGPPGGIKFSVSRGALYYFKAKKGQTLLEPEDIQFKDIPVYPQASLVPLSSIVTPLRRQVGFSTNEPLAQVVKFYKQKLPLAGWRIVDELPMTDYDPKVLQDCPNCGNLSKDTLAAAKGLSLESTGIKAVKGQEVCIIGVSASKAAGRGMGETRISITVSKVQK